MIFQKKLIEKPREINENQLFHLSGAFEKAESKLMPSLNK